MRSLFPCDYPVRVVAMYALQSAGYIPASDWVRKYSKVDSEETQALWKAAWNPKVITLTDSDRIFFDGYSRPRGRERYFVAPEEEYGLDSNILTPVDSIDAPCMTPRKRRQNPYEYIRRILHERTESTSYDRATGVRRQPTPSVSRYPRCHASDSVECKAKSYGCSTRLASSSSEDLRSRSFGRGGGWGIRRFYVSFNPCYARSTMLVTKSFIGLT